MFTIKQHREILGKVLEIKNLEDKFCKIPSYTKATLLMGGWEECLDKNIKYNDSFLMDFTTEKISLYSGFIEGVISEYEVKENIENNKNYLIKIINKLENILKN